MFRIVFCIAAINIGATACVADDTYNNLVDAANAAILKGDYDTAVARCDRAIRLDATVPGAYIARSWALLNLNKNDDAIKDCTTVLSLAPTAKEESSAYVNRGEAYHGKKAYEKALKDFELAIKADPKNPLGHNGVAWLYATCSDAKYLNGEKALEEIRKARSLDPHDANFLDTAAAVYAECGDFDQAITYQELGIKGENKSNTSGDDAVKQMKGRLELYKKKMPYRE